MTSASQAANVSRLTPKNQPAAYIGAALSAALAVASLFVHITDAQWQPILAAAPLLTGLVTRFFVSPAGTSVAEQLQAALADANTRQTEAATDLAALRAAVAAILPAPVTAPVTAAVIAPVPAPVIAPVAPVTPEAASGPTLHVGSWPGV